MLVVVKMAFAQPDLEAGRLDPVSRALGVAVDGIHGNDILHAHSLRLNFSRQELVAAPLSRRGRPVEA